MTLIEIKTAVDKGSTVYWGNVNYVVIKDRFGEYMIKCVDNDHCIGLTHKDGITLNGEQHEFSMYL